MTMASEERAVSPRTGLAAMAEAAPRLRPGTVALTPCEYLSFRLGAEEYGIDILRAGDPQL